MKLLDEQFPALRFIYFLTKDCKQPQNNHTWELIQWKKKELKRMI